MYDIVFTNQTIKQIKSNLKNTPLEQKVKNLIKIIKENPYKIPPPYEKLINNKNCYSRRINVKHRLVYEVFEKQKIIKILSVWTHYEF